MGPVTVSIVPQLDTLPSILARLSRQKYAAEPIAPDAALRAESFRSNGSVVLNGVAVRDTTWSEGESLRLTWTRSAHDVRLRFDFPGAPETGDRLLAQALRPRPVSRDEEPIDALPVSFTRGLPLLRVNERLSDTLDLSAAPQSPRTPILPRMADFIIDRAREVTILRAIGAKLISRENFPLEEAAPLSDEARLESAFTRASIARGAAANIFQLALEITYVRRHRTTLDTSRFIEAGPVVAATLTLTAANGTGPQLLICAGDNQRSYVPLSRELLAGYDCAEQRQFLAALSHGCSFADSQLPVIPRTFHRS